MPRHNLPILLAAAVTVVAPVMAAATPEPADEPLPSVAEYTSRMTQLHGLTDLYVDGQHGKVFLAVAPARAGEVVASYLYVEGLVQGLGSNPVGLDRSQLGPTRIVDVRRVGEKVLLQVPNLAFRARTAAVAEQRAVEESFASSVLWAAPAIAADADGTILVDFTPFLVRDAHGVAARLADTGQGEFDLDRERSAVDLDSILVFPDNVEIEAILTYASEDPGPEVRGTAPLPTVFTVTQHHSLIRLPDDRYRPRRFDPRAGSFGVSFTDYAAALDEPLRVRWIARHRLEKRDPTAVSSPVIEPIVYYLDPGVPEPVRSALLDGARWWATAFAAAGFEDAFRVELLPEGAHPLDVRYNVIQWVHRATRGWSYGGGVIDPRTGEIVKGHVLLGSLRVRQDIRIFESLLGADGTGRGGADDPVELALARLRQLAAHEVGHTLGLNHNFAASALGRVSVMDYPAPLVTTRPDGSLDVSGAYEVGVGAWDVQAIRYAYSEFAPGTNEAEALDRIVQDGLAAGLVLLTDQDARPSGAAHPIASLWDNGADPVAELDRVMAVRRAALARFNAGNLARGRPLAELQETLAPLYFYHRYQLAAAAKVLGGLEYRHALRGDGQPPARPVSPEWQRAALDRLLACLRPQELDIPEEVLGVLLPRPTDQGRNREMFVGRTAPAFDPLAAAATAAALVTDAVLQPERLGRMVDFHRRDQRYPDAGEAIEALVDHTFGAVTEPRLHELQRAVQWVVVDRLVELAADGEAASGVRTRATAAIRSLAGRLARATPDADERDHRDAMRNALIGYLERSEWMPSQLPLPPSPPPGDPIGAACAWSSWHD